MNRFGLHAAIAFLPLVANANADTIVQWSVADGGNGHYYQLVGDYLDPDQRWSWEDANTMAESLTYLGLQGHLVTVTSAAENQFLIDTFHTANPYPTWLGFTDSEAFGGTESFGQPNPQVDGWVWVTGEAVTFTGWFPGSPENTNNEDFAVMGAAQGDHHLWNDVQSGSGGHAPFFVEYEASAVPAPSTLVMSSILFGMYGVRGAFKRLKRWKSAD